MSSSMFVNMAVADLLITLVVMPFSVIHLHNGGKWLIVDDLAGEITCRGFYFVGAVTAVSSILCLAFNDGLRQIHGGSLPFPTPSVYS